MSSIPQMTKNMKWRLLVMYKLVSFMIGFMN
jgi:amino acid permease